MKHWDKMNEIERDERRKFLSENSKRWCNMTPEEKEENKAKKLALYRVGARVKKA